MFEEVYAELRVIARRECSRLPLDTLSTTAIIHEAWLKLHHSGTRFESRSQYLGTAARAMRQLLIDYARYRHADRRDASLNTVLTESEDHASATAAELLAIEQSLERVEAIDPAMARMVEYRFYAGMTLDEIAEHEGVSKRSITRRWARARALLKLFMDG